MAYVEDRLAVPSQLLSAIAFCHSATRKYAMPYLRRVQRLWLVERRREAVQLRNARIEALRMEKAERQTKQAGDG